MASYFVVVSNLPRPQCRDPMLAVCTCSQSRKGQEDRQGEGLPSATQGGSLVWKAELGIRLTGPVRTL